MQQFEKVHKPKEPSLQAVSHRSAKAERITPIRKEDFKKMVELLRNKKFLPTKSIVAEDITRRDIIEYAYTRLTAYTLDQLSIKLLEFNFLRDSIEKLHHEMQVIMHEADNIYDGLRFTRAQRSALEEAISLLIEDLLTFSTELVPGNEEQYVRQHLGIRLQQLPQNSYTLDLKKFPGAVVIRITPQEYVKIASPSSQGTYIPTLGEGKLKGRFLLIRSQEPTNESSEYHEYLHYLHKKLHHLKPFPQKEKLAETKVVEKTAAIDFKIAELGIKEKHATEEKYIEMRQSGSTSQALRQQLMGIQNQIQRYEQKRDAIEYFTHAEIISYNDPQIRKAFDKVIDELQAYTIAGNVLPRRIIANTLGNEFAETLSKTTQGRLFLQELGVLRAILDEAVEIGLNPQEVGFLISGARNLSQAAKFVYLHLIQTRLI